MECLNPIFIKVPDYEVAGNYVQTPVPCGVCSACISNSSIEWRQRLSIENAYCNNSYFITLTYSDEKVPLSQLDTGNGVSRTCAVVSKRDIQLFFKRLRKAVEPYKIKYFVASEYGPTTLRPHYHGIVFDMPFFSDDIQKQDREVHRIIEKCWNNGAITVDRVTDSRISYVTKYINSYAVIPQYLPKPFRLMSRRPAIGISYLDNTDRIDWHRKTLSCFVPRGTKKMKLPRYLKDKIFDDDMKASIRENSIEFKKSRIKEDYNKLNVSYSRYIEIIRDRQENFNRKFLKNAKQQHDSI